MSNPFKRTAATRTLFFILSDVVVIALSIWLAFILRFDANIPSQYDPFIVRMIVLAVIFIIPIFYFKRLYSFSWSYVSTNEIVSVFWATTISFVFLAIAIFISKYSPYFINFPRSTIFISYILVFMFCSALRFSKRIYLNAIRFRKIIDREKTLIVGAGDTGEQIVRSILSSKMGSYSPVGFVDDNQIKQGVKIHGLRVLGKISDIPAVVKKNQIKQLIIALPSASNKVIKNAVDLGRKAGLRKIKIAPSLGEIMRGEVSPKNLRDVDVEDLLGRDSLKPDIKQMEDLIRGAAVLITGAAGSIGSELSRQTAKFRPQMLLLLDQDETGIFTIVKELERNFPDVNIHSLVADIRDKEKIEDIFSKLKPQIVFHAAAYKHVPLMEAQPDEAVKNNILGTKVLVQASLNNQAKKFIFISTDKAVNPTSVMGATKRVGEMICQAYNQKNVTKFISVRFGNVLDSRGSVIPIFREQIKRKGPVEVTHPDMQRYFMLTYEACLLVMQAGAMGQGGEVFVLDMGKPVKILDLAKEMITLSGFEPDRDIPIIFTGMRPGEKLFEEILTAEEGTIATQNQKIFMAKLSGGDVVNMEEKLDALQSAVSARNNEEIVSELKKIVPYYK